VVRRRSVLKLGAALAATWLEAPAARLARAQERPPAGESRLGLAAGDRDGLLYVPRAVERGAPLPLVVMLHGAGGSGRSVDYTFPIAEELGMLVLAPDSRDWTWDALLQGFGPDVAFIGSAFRHVAGEFPVDRRHVALAGHSDGASYTLSMGVGYGDVFTHLLAFSPGVMRPVDVHGKPRIFISHGTRDPVMPIDDTSRTFVPRLRALGYDVTYREYDGQHGVPLPIVHDAFAWFLT
jgi:phospholipase/carboxylesterase